MADQNNSALEANLNSPTEPVRKKSAVSFQFSFGTIVFFFSFHIPIFFIILFLPILIPEKTKKMCPTAC